MGLLDVYLRIPSGITWSKRFEWDISFLPKYEGRAHRRLTSRSAIRNTFHIPIQSSDSDTAAVLGKDEIYIARECLIVQGSINREATVFDMSNLCMNGA